MVSRISFCFIFFLMVAANGVIAQKLRVMSYNIHHGRNAAGEVDLNGIAEVIKNSGAEIIGLQEVDSVCGRSGKVDQMKVLAELTGMYYAFRRHFAYDGGAYGLGMLSKYPITGVRGNRISSYSKDSDDDKTLVFLTADLQLNANKTVHFGTVHLDYRKDPAIRLQQAEEVKAYLSKIPHAVILTGDLNAEPDKKEIKTLYKVFADTDDSDAFTFPASAPVKKIDYILVTKPHLKKVIHHEVIPEDFASDHRPVVATVKL